MNSPRTTRTPFIPSKPATPVDRDSPVTSGAVSRLRQQYDQHESPPSVSPLTTSNLASLDNVKQPIVRAKITPSAAPRKKINIPGAERADTPVSRRPPVTPGRPASVYAPETITRSIRTQSSLDVRPQSAFDSYAPISAANLETPIHRRAATEPDAVSLTSSGKAAKQDTVVVCVRIRPAALSTAASARNPSGYVEEAWAADARMGTVSLIDDARASNDFRFDAVVTGSGNSQIYHSAGKPLIRSCMEGFDAVIFAYGQTASGKTFTLTGTQLNPGIIPQAVTDIFEYIRANPHREFLLRASYLEIYNEQLKDLLAPETQGLVKIRQDESKRFFVSPLREEVVTGEQQVAALLLRGEANRHTGSTDYNARSSRSHTVFQMIVESREAGSGDSFERVRPGQGVNGSRLAANGGGAVKISRLSLIDLAGSEKATSQQERRVEGAFINKSLLTLEKVVAALTDDKPRTHIPYRDSKLTQILQPSLSGTAKVAVICTINPSTTAIEESKSTLKFASRVKKVQVAAQSNEIIDDKALLNKYRNQIAELQAQLAEKAAEVAAVPQTPRGPAASKHRESTTQNKAQVEALKNQIESLQTLFLTSKNVDLDRDELPVRPLSIVKEAGPDKDPEVLLDQLNDAQEKIADLEDKITKLLAELKAVRDDLAARPAVARDAPEHEKDRVLAALQKELREMEVILANTDPEEAAKRERRMVERDWSARVRTLERDAIVRKETEAKANELLAAERKRTKELEQFIIQHLTQEAEKLAERRSSTARRSSIGLSDDVDMPSLLDEETNLGLLTSSFQSMTFDRLSDMDDEADRTPSPPRRHRAMVSR